MQPRVASTGDEAALPAGDGAAAGEELRRYAETVAFRMQRTRRRAALTVFPGITLMFAAMVAIGVARGIWVLVPIAGIAFLITAGNLREEFLPALRDEPVVTVGPDGLRLRRVGLIPWAAVSRVELEKVTGFAGHDDLETPRSASYSRIGIWPRDERFVRHTNWLGRHVLDAYGLAPLGIYGFMVEAPLPEVAERIGLYVDVENAAAR